MSQGLTTYDFVQQVYYAQEKVVLDFWPTDDKFKEVLFEANLVLQELQSIEDWTWLRDRIELGDCHHHCNEIPEFKLPPDVYKESTLYHDSLKLYFHRYWHNYHYHHEHHHHGFPGSYSQSHYIEVPFISAGANGWRKEREVSPNGILHVPDRRLRAVRIGDIVTFNRMLTPAESHTVAVLDVQRRIEQFHICDADCSMITEIEYYDKADQEWKTKELLKPVCEHDCHKVMKQGHLIAVEPYRHLTVIPDPNYVVMATAARHAEGSPPAQFRVQSLNDTAQRILSAMRQNDASATDSDYAEWDIPGYIEIV